IHTLYSKTSDIRTLKSGKLKGIIRIYIPERGGVWRDANEAEHEKYIKMINEVNEQKLQKYRDHAIYGKMFGNKFEIIDQRGQENVRKSALTEKKGKA